MAQSVLRGIRAIARDLGIPPSTAWRWHRAGLLPTVHAGGRITAPAAAVPLFVAALARAAHAARPPAAAGLDSAAEVRRLAAMLRRISLSKQSVTAVAAPQHDQGGGVVSGGRGSGLSPVPDKKQRGKARSAHQSGAEGEGMHQNGAPQRVSEDLLT